ncbi:hypothetical protein [Kordiimonas sp.]|uniref:hypothetical protein n=1 Tax=Kordiimonas sp. TaxID=1970157 RepID=UPI003A9089B8
MKIYLHIGTHKTGTTSIQAFAEKHRAWLLNYGLYWPQTSSIRPASTQHTILLELIRAGKADNASDYVVQEIMSAERSGAQSMLLSGEGFAQASDEEIEIFLGMLEGHDVQVIAYFRNVYDYARSSLIQHMKYSDRRPRVGLLYRSIQTNLNYSALLKRWQRFLPDDVINVYSYEDEKQALLPTFFARLAVPEDGVRTRLAPKSYRSIDPSLQLLLACIENDRGSIDFNKTSAAYRWAFKGRRTVSPLINDMVAKICEDAGQKLNHPLLKPYRKKLLAVPAVAQSPSLREQAIYFTSLARFSRRMARRKRFESSGLYPLWQRLRIRLRRYRKHGSK